jgi:hypothetical protein
MSYRIEYLTETTREDSVCHAIDVASGTLDSVEAQAMAHSEAARQHGATGFQIRHVNAVDKVIAIVDFAEMA